MADHTEKQESQTPANTEKQESQTPANAEKQKPQAAKPAVSRQEPKARIDADPSKRVSLVELIMVLLLVGLVLVFIFGMQQIKIDKKNELIAHEKVENVIPSIESIIKAMEDYRKADEFGDYPIDIGEIDIVNKLKNPDFTFAYDAEAYIVKAITTKEFGKEGIEINYSLPNSVYEVIDPTPKEKPTIKDDWLP